VGEWRDFDERLIMFLLRFRRRHRFGHEAEGPIHPPSEIPGYDPNEEVPFDPEGELEGCLVALDCAPDPSEDDEDDGPLRTDREQA